MPQTACSRLLLEMTRRGPLALDRPGHGRQAKHSALQVPPQLEFTIGQSPQILCSIKFRDDRTGSGQLEREAADTLQCLSGDVVCLSL